MTFAAGILLMKYSVQITDQFTGKIELAEKYLGTGIGAGTYTWWKIFGLILCIIAVLWLFNKLPHGAAPQEFEQPAAMLMLLVKNYL